MSLVKIRQALETEIATFIDLPIANENVNFSAPIGPYASTDLLFAEPFDSGYKDSDVLQRGYIQITLHYPTGQATGEADAKAELVRSTMKRGNSYLWAGQVINVERTPEITGGQVENGRYTKRVRIRFYSQFAPA